MPITTVTVQGKPMQAYLPATPDRVLYCGKRPAVLILPGGGYAFTFVGEGEPIALRFASQGIAAFVLPYTCTDTSPCAFPYAQREAFAAIKHIRDNAATYGIDPDNITVCGFSAGGHLAACTGTLWNKKENATFFDPAKAEVYRPDKLMLCYPVIRGTPPCHAGSFQNLFGTQTPTQEQLQAYSLQTRVDAQTPPTFLWATAEDDAVPVAGALEFASALNQNGVRFELHVWPRGGHGLCLGDQTTEALPYGNALPVSRWIEEAVRFVYEKETER